MAETKIGGFYAAVGLKTDQDSFDKAHRAIEKTSNSLNHFITALKSAALAIGVDKLTAMAAQELNTAQAIGVSVTELDNWQVAATRAGTKAEGLASSLSKLHNAFIDEELNGTVNEQLVRNITNLGLNWNNLRSLSNSDRLKEVLDAASKMQDQAEALRLVETTIGTDGRQLYQYMMRKYEGNVDAMLRDAAQYSYETKDSHINSQMFQDELNDLKSSITSIAALGIGELAGPLSEIVKPLNDWLHEHGTDITEAMKTLSGHLYNIINFFKKTAKDKEDLESQRAIAKRNLEAANVQKDNGGRYMYSKLPKYLKAEVDENPLAYSPYLDQTPGVSVLDDIKLSGIFSYLWNQFEYGMSLINTGVMGPGSIPGIHDGIISPTGQITQVAPDDWVIAAKDLSNIGAAFVPQSTISSSASYTINQTINVNGSTNAQQIRQQAYSGAQNGLLDAMQESVQRLQLMPQAR